MAAFIAFIAKLAASIVAGTKVVKISFHSRLHLLPSANIALPHIPQVSQWPWK
jgi:hypothetical protein